MAKKIMTQTQSHTQKPMDGNVRPEQGDGQGEVRRVPPQDD
jgi:hypothetical protein